MTATNSLELTCAPEAAGQRLDVWLLAALLAAGQDVSRAGVQRWIKEGFVRAVRGDATALLANPAKKIQAGERVRVDVPAAVASTLVAEDIPLTIVFEDDDLLVLNKPAGLTVHPAPGHATGTLVQALLHHCAKAGGGTSLSGINGELRPGIVHRIDKDTSGLLVVAKHDVAHRALAKQFARHSIEREYLAVVRGVPRPVQGVLDGAIGRHPVHRLRRAVVPEGGKEAITHYQVLESYGVQGTSGVAALVACTLETGRTHQIRVHLSHFGHPLLGDPMYGATFGTWGPRQGMRPLPAGLVLPHRQLLHAGKLGFEHPRTGEWLSFSCELPPEMAAVLDFLREL